MPIKKGGITSLVILDKGTVVRTVYIERVLPVAFEYGHKSFSSDWIFQHDGAGPHTHHLTQQRCQQNFPSFIDTDRWPPSRLDLNPLGYSI